MADVDLTEYNGGPLVGTAIFFLALTYISVGLRTYVRAVMTKGFMADDWLMLAAQTVFTISCVFLLVGVEHGLGRHNKALPQDQEILALMWQALATATYILNMMFIKLSIAVFLLRLAVQRRYTYTIYTSMVVVAIWSLALFLWDIFQCSPVQAQWDYTIPDLKCVSAQEVVNGAYALSIMTIISDFLYALLPIPMVWKVQMTTQAKSTVVVILGLGIFASIATLIRLKFLSDLTDTADILFAGTDAMIWTLVEPGVAIVASSLVTVRPLLRKLRLKGFESTERSKGVLRSGRSGGGISANGLGSKTTRSQQQRGMPGYGPDDLDLVDLERGVTGLGYTSRGTTITSRMSTKSTPVWAGGVAITTNSRGVGGDYSIPEHPHSGMETPGSDVYVIEGPTMSNESPGPWGIDSPISPGESERIQSFQGLTAPSRAGSRLSNHFAVQDPPTHHP